MPYTGEQNSSWFQQFRWPQLRPGTKRAPCISYDKFHDPAHVFFPYWAYLDWAYLDWKLSRRNCSVPHLFFHCFLSLCIPVYHTELFSSISCFSVPPFSKGHSNTQSHCWTARLAITKYKVFKHKLFTKSTENTNCYPTKGKNHFTSTLS